MAKILLVGILSATFFFGQVSPPGYSVNQKRPKPLRLAPLSQEEAKRPPKGPVRQTGVQRALPAKAFDKATVTTLPSGRRLWRLTIESPGAIGLRIHFRGYDGAGGELWVYAPPKDGQAIQCEGPFTGKGPFDDGDFWTGILRADSVTIEYVEAA